MRRSLLPLLGVLVLAVTASHATAQMPRRVYVLHSGVHLVISDPDKNAPAELLRSGLAERGVPKRDLIVLESPFPKASWKHPFPREAVRIFLDSTDPDSKVAQQAYLRLDLALKMRSVTAADELIWIGHSAGGQMGMTLAHLAHNLKDYPELARQARAYHFVKVITLGTPVGSDCVPDDVPLCHYHSPADSAVSLLCRHGALLAHQLGYEVRFRPCGECRPGATIRVFDGVGHRRWYRTPHILDALAHESRAADRPQWRRARADGPPGAGLARLLAQAVEVRAHVSLEDPPGR